ncbi:Protein of unknown function [Pyronema omphalodes CBS 100304]|uniref:Uncharacterized protein n=1 Tax=Pyronema omphalodes (strain CBS 100304) TaxID=1076935 RepID=U4LYD4_PYROM|nr:Protein of unknown function [Pyronema omphalodes CBS 100304]
MLYSMHKQPQSWRSPDFLIDGHIRQTADVSCIGRKYLYDSPLGLRWVSVPLHLVFLFLVYVCRRSNHFQEKDGRPKITFRF